MKYNYAYFLFLAVLLFPGGLNAQKKWTGNGGDGQWNNPANWSDNTIPSSTDDVLLDNSFVVSSYTVTLPVSTSVVVKTIYITATGSSIIELLLPAANTLLPAFTATGPGYGILLNKGAVFRNSSSVSSGTNLLVADSIQISNGGKYIHNTRASHAANIVQVLSRMPGTETGTIEFDVPGGAYTTSISNRIYGNLILSAVASGGTQSYNSIGANPCTLRGNLEIKDGVIFNIDLTNSFNILGNLYMSNSMFNLASQPNTTIYKIEGNIQVSPGSVITESSTGSPTIELAGSASQQIDIQGSVVNDIIFKMNGVDATLLSPLILPYKLHLMNGRIYTSAAALLTLAAGCGLQYDSATDNSFIAGPLRKEGLSAADHFMFPIGKDASQRWLALKNVTGNFTVEFMKMNPQILSTIYGAGIHHISGIEYWTIQADASPSSIANVELSFNNVNSGGVTDMATLRAAQLFSAVWNNIGNISTTGSAGASGSVTSVAVGISGPAPSNFTLASNVALQNPLPMELLSFLARRESNNILLTWSISNNYNPDSFEVQRSENSMNFKSIGTVRTINGVKNYSFMDMIMDQVDYLYRLKIVEKNGRESLSRVIKVSPSKLPFKIIYNMASPGASNMSVAISCQQPSHLTICLKDISGRSLYMQKGFFDKGVNNVQVPLFSLGSGYYWLQVAGEGYMETRQFMH